MREISYDIESGLNEAPSTHIEMFFLTPDEFSIRIESKELSNSVISERSKLFKSNNSNILFIKIRLEKSLKKIYVNLLVSSSIEQIEVNLTRASNDLFDLGRFDDFFGELFEQDSSESIANLEFIQITSSLIVGDK